MKTRLVIVGNQIPQKENIFWNRKPKSTLLDQFIDDSDYVVRINNAPNFNNRTGSKTDCLALINVGTPAVEFSYTTKINAPLKNQCKDIFFTRPKEPTIIDAIQHFPTLCQQDMSKYILEFQDLADKNIEFTCKKKFLTTSALVGSNFIPSSGLIVINHFISNQKFSDFEIYIIGFSWQGWSGHNWEAEKNYTEKCKKEGKLKILSID